MLPDTSRQQKGFGAERSMFRRGSVCAEIVGVQIRCASAISVPDVLLSKPLALAQPDVTAESVKEGHNPSGIRRRDWSYSTSRSIRLRAHSVIVTVVGRRVQPSIDSAFAVE